MAQLRQHDDVLKGLNTRVAVISFGTFPGAKAWVQETAVPFDFFLDPQLKAYKAYGLERSLIRSWGPKVWFTYARLLLSGRRWRGVQGDSAQLGGDFVVDKNGIICLAYPSHDPTDRPSINSTLEILQWVKRKG